MMPLKNFCAAIDRKKPNFLEELKIEGKIRNEATHEDELKPREKQLLQEMEASHFEDNYNSQEQVMQSIYDNIRWRNMHKIDMDQIVEHGNKYRQDQLRANKKKVKAEKMGKLNKIESDDSDAEAKKAQLEKELESDDEEADIPAVYAYPVFCKPGRQMFLVGNGCPEDDENKWYLHKFIAPQRIDPIPLFHK